MTEREKCESSGITVDQAREQRTYTFTSVAPSWAKRSGMVRYVYLYRDDEVIGSMSRSENGLIWINITTGFTPQGLALLNEFVQELVKEWG